MPLKMQTGYLKFNHFSKRLSNDPEQKEFRALI